MKAAPDYMASTIKMLRAAFPSGIREDELPVLMSAMRDSGMSDRNVATALGIMLDKDYSVVLHDVGTCDLDLRVTRDAKSRMVDRLSPHGYEAWCKED